MKKDLLERFAKKYYLNGIIDSAVWVKENETLQVLAITPSKKVFAGVKFKDFHAFDDTKFGVLVTGRLLALLKSIPFEDVSFDIVKNDSGEVKALTFSAEKSKIQYVTTGLGEMGTIPTLKYIPPWDTSIILDDEFKQWFFGAYSAIATQDTLFTPIMSEQTGKLEVVLNYQKNRIANSLYFQPNTVDNKSTVNAPIGFNAKCLKEVLRANPEFKDLVLNVSNMGIASITCSEADLEAQYYLVKIDTED